MEKFIRIHEEKLLEELLKTVKPNGVVREHTFSIPKTNINPLTLLRGNTVVDILNRDPFSPFSKLTVYYNRKHLKEYQENLEKLVVSDQYDLYSVLTEIKIQLDIEINRHDVYNTSIKEFPDGKLYLVVLARPESYQLRGSLTVEVIRKPTAKTIVLKTKVINRTDIDSVILTANIIDRNAPVAINLIATEQDR